VVRRTLRGLTGLVFSRFVFLRRTFALLAILGLPAGVLAQVVTPEIDRGLTWLQAQVQSDFTVVSEDAALAERLQVRCEVRSTLVAFNKLTRVPVCPNNVTLTEILARGGNTLPANYWLTDGGVAPDTGYEASSVVDTTWALNSGNTTTAQVQGAINYLYGYQSASGGFAASRSGPETVAATGLIGRQLSLQSKLLAGTQASQLTAASDWVIAQAQAPGNWSSLYETALAHLFLVLERPDASRDAATYEYFVANQQANGSWQDDPFLTALVLRAAGARSVPRTSESAVRVRVIDALTRAPIQGASVNAGSGSPPVTDANGYATALASPAASVSVFVSKSGYQSRTLTAAVTSGAITDLGEVELQPLASQVLVSGEVINDATLAPLSGVSVLISVNGTVQRVVASDSNGHFESNLTTAGRYRVDFSKSGFLNSVSEFDAVLGNHYQVDSRLRPTASNSNGALRGVVTDTATGAPLSGVAVTWRSVANANTTTAADGTYLLSNLVRETGELSFSKSGYLGKTMNGVVPASPELIVNAALDKAAATTGSVSGTAKDSASGTALAGVRVELLDKSTNASIAVLTSDAAGLFSVGNLAFKTYKFTASLTGYATLTGEFTLNTLTPFVNLNLSMPRAVGAITGKVVDKANGSPIAGATVKAGTTQVQADAAGLFTLNGLAAALYSLEVSATGYRTNALSISVVTGQVTDVGKVELVAGTGSAAEVFGTVKSKNGGASIAGATVSIVLSNIATATDLTGAFELRDIPLGDREIRVVAPGYQPATYKMALMEAIRYRLDAVLTPVDANAVTMNSATDFASYGAYASGKVTTTFTVSSAVSQITYLEFGVFDSAGRQVKSLPEPGGTTTLMVSLGQGTPAHVMPFTTGNLAPGNYRVEVSLYDSQSTAGSTNRALLAQTNANFTIVAMQKFGAVSVIPLPTYANVAVPTAAGYRLEITNRSNVQVTFDIDLRLQGPGGITVGAASQRVTVRPDEVFKQLDVSAGTIAFTPHGQYQAIAAIAGVDPPPLSAGAITVAPAVRMEVQQKVLPEVIPPGADQKIRIDIRLKGAGQ
jgi:hypothetical protein